MSDEAKYPIYSVDIQWTEDGNEPHPQKNKPDPGEGRRWNRTGWSEMHREEQDPEALMEKARTEWWPKYLEQPGKVGQLPVGERNPNDLTIIVKLTHHETWCQEWFSHFTFDTGQTDAEALRSFAEYVSRHEFYQDWDFKQDDDGRDMAFLKAQGVEHRVILMGAQDRYRWTGSGATGDRNTDSEPPCRCVHCKKQGKIRIGH